MIPVVDVWTEMPWWGWAVMALVGVIVGFSKTAIGNVVLIGVAAMAWLLPARDSTGVLLIMLLAGDVIAVCIYRKDVDWRLLARMIVPVLIGVGAGGFFLGRVDDQILERTIGIILLVLLGVSWWMQRRGADAVQGGLLPSLGYGSLAGFTTMVANAGGPAMSLYLLAAKFDKWRFIGTSAWFFFSVNVVKLPISIGLGIIRPQTAVLSVTLIPAVIAGTIIGRVLIKRIAQDLFERLVTIFVVVAALYLVIA